MRVPDFLVARFFHPLWDRYEGSIRLKTLKRLERTQWLSREQLQTEANARLNRLCRHAVATSPFHARRFSEAGIDPEKVASIEDLAGLPILTKQDIRENLDSILSSSFRKEELVPAKTGGSTGVSLQVYCDQPAIEMRHAAALRSDMWSGWKLGQPLAAVWGNPPVATTFKNKVRQIFRDRIIYLDTMKIDDEAIDSFVAEWKPLRPGLLFGHAHSIFILAEALQDRGIKLRPSGIVATSMMLIEPERKVIEEVFGVPVTNRYGCEEVSLIACECEQHDGMHLNLDHIIVEFLRDDGTPCGPGEDGRIVVTELINMGMPMIRYEVGDRGVPSDRKCFCGRGLPILENLTGRVADFLVAEGGYRVAGISIIENSLTKIPGIRQMQIVQNEKMKLEVNVVKGAQYSHDSKHALVIALQQMLGPNMDVMIHHVANIPQEKSGKYRFTVCNISLEAGPRF